MLNKLVEADDGRNERQLGIVDGRGNSASFTGPECMDRAGGRAGKGYVARAGVANLEERVDGNDAIDPVVLTALRDEDAAD